MEGIDTDKLLLKNAMDSIPKKTLILYVIFFILALVLSAFNMLAGRIDQLLLSVPTAIMLLIALITDRRVAHVPPLLILMMMVTLSLVVISYEFKDAHNIFDVASSMMTGVCLMLMGQVVVYTMLHSSPEKEQDNKAFVYTAAFSIAMAILLIMFLVQLVHYHFQDYMGFEIWVVTQYVIYAVCGAAITAFLSELGLDRIVINSGLNKSLETYPDRRYSNEYALNEARDIIRSGESEKLEFKSTITTNLNTFENDKRMEKAVLKTLVAFLNTTGGILMIGVSDDGSVYGVDDLAFENRDKMGLHFTNMISSKIGDEYYPYISFRMIETDEPSYNFKLNLKANIVKDPSFGQGCRIAVSAVNNGTPLDTGIVCFSTEAPNNKPMYVDIPASGEREFGLIKGKDTPIRIRSLQAADELSVVFIDSEGNTIGQVPKELYDLEYAKVNKVIIRVDCSKCKKPVFLKDGKVEEFYVRSGPSSVELAGSNLVNYVKNKSSKDKEKFIRVNLIDREE